MNEGGPACVLIGAHGREHGGDGGADILAHDDGNGTAISHCASGGQGLKDSHRSGGGLDDGSEDSSGQHAQNGVGEHQQDVGKGGHIGQATAPDMVSMPNIRVAKPSRMAPMSFFLLLFKKT